MELIDTSKSILENLYLLSGPVLAILGFVAIFQLKLTKKAIIVGSKRQAAELASSQIDNYLTNIIKDQDTLFELNQEQKIQRKRFENLVTFTREEILIQFEDEKALNSYAGKSMTNLTEILGVLNKMESFSTYFTKGVADEEIAFSAVGRTFCHSVEVYSFDISIMRNNKDNGAFNNIVELYNVWNERLKSERLTKELIDKQEELKNLKIQKVDILGTK
jgi:hypothetical protein